MDSEEGSKFESEEREEVEEGDTMEKVAAFDENKVGINGDLVHEEGVEIHAEVRDGFTEEKGSGTPVGELVPFQGVVKANGDIAGNESPSESSSKAIRSSSPADGVLEETESKSVPSKGYGLKKWRRIRRDLNKDGSPIADSTQILKRRLSLAEPSKAREEKQKSEVEGEREGEVLAALLESRNTGVALEGGGAAGVLDPELELLVVNSGFSIGMDSENSEDRSSKSSTAASAPRLRYDTIGFGRERSSGKNLGGRGSGHVQQRVQRGRGGGIDMSKKIRGDQIRFEKENSHSSVESDLRSSNAGFLRRASAASNGLQREGSFNYDREHSEEAQASEEGKSSYYKKNGRVDDLSREGLDADLLEDSVEKSENSGPNSDLDPFVESMMMLQAAQEVLENEIQKFGEIGKEALSTLDDDYAQIEETEGSSSPTLPADLINLTQKTECLELKLQEVLASLKSKESKVLELEAILATQSSEKETGSCGIQCLRDQRTEIEIDLEGLLKRKIESEVEYMIISRTTQSLKVLTEDHVALFEEQKNLAEDQTQLIQKQSDAQNEVLRLKKRAEELETLCKELIATEEVLKAQNKVSNMSLCFVVQLVILCIVLGLFLLQLSSQSGGFVPT